MFDFLTQHITGSAVSYLVILAIVCVDSFFPLVPGETAVITGGVLAANGSMSIPLVLVTAIVGGIAGDNITYGIGRLVGAPARQRLFRSEKAVQRLAWAEVQLERRATFIIIAARFIPGGRTATMFAAGGLEMPWRRFVVADAIAAAAWVLYAFGLGFLGGETFRHSLWKPLGIAFIIAAIVTALGETYRRRHLGDDAEVVDRRRRQLLRERRNSA